MIHDTIDGRLQENDSAMKEKWYVKYLSVGAFLIRFWCQKVCPPEPFDARALLRKRMRMERLGIRMEERWN
jgi:hypothetical protein